MKTTEYNSTSLIKIQYLFIKRLYGHPALPTTLQSQMSGYASEVINISITTGSMHIIYNTCSDWDEYLGVVHNKNVHFDSCVWLNRPINMWSNLVIRCITSIRLLQSYTTCTHSPQYTHILHMYIYCTNSTYPCILAFTFSQLTFETE